jgi:hypothetical protein
VTFSLADSIHELAILAALREADLAGICRNLPSHYHSQSRAKKGGGDRILLVPSAALKRVQRHLLRSVLADLPVDSACCSRSGSSVLTHVERHVGSRRVLTCDIASAFPSVTSRRVRAGLRTAGVPALVIPALVRVCTFRDQLPQGAPTSSALLDLALVPMDRALVRLVRRHGWKYSRYVDDLCFSGSHAVPQLLRQIGEVIARWHLRLAPNKTQRWASGSTATVTGLVLNRKPSVSFAYRRQVESLVDRALRGSIVLTRQDRASLRGKASWIGRYHPRAGSRLGTKLSKLRDQ